MDFKFFDADNHYYEAEDAFTTTSMTVHPRTGTRSATCGPPHRNLSQLKSESSNQHFSARIPRSWTPLG